MIYFIKSTETGYIKLIQTVDIVKNRYKLKDRYGPFEAIGRLDAGAWEMERIQLLFGASRVEDQHTGREWFHPTDKLLAYIAQHAPLTDPAASDAPGVDAPAKPPHSPQVNVTLSRETMQILEQLALAKQRQEGSHRVFVSDMIRDAIQEYLDTRGITAHVQIQRAAFYHTQRGRRYAQRKKR